MNQFMVLNATLKRTDGAFNKGLYGAGEFGYSMETTSSAIMLVQLLQSSAHIWRYIKFRH
jgi:hypothetical protein